MLFNETCIHYCLITNFDKLLNHHDTSHTSYIHCDRCLNRFSSRDKMNDHVELCHQNKPQKLTMPKLLENDKIPTHNF